MDLLLDEWELVKTQLDKTGEKIKQRYERNETCMLLGSTPAMNCFNTLSVVSRIGDIDDFRRGASLANFWGITPGARNSGDNNASLSITKAGSSHVRYVLGQVVLHVLRQDAWMRQWYQKIKRRRGSKIARVAVMRRLATILWSMLKYKVPYIKGGPEKFKEYLRKHKEFFGETHMTAGRV